MKPQTGESGFFAAKALLRAFSTEKGVPSFHVDPTVIPHYDPSTHTIVCKGTPRGDLSDEALTAFRAALDHELAESQITTWHLELARRYPGASDPKDLHLVCNGIGDIKVDDWIGSKYPGTELNIYKAVRHDYECFTERQATEPLNMDNPWNRILVTAVTCRYMGDGVCTIDDFVSRAPHLTPLLEKIRHEVENLQWNGPVEALVDQAERLYELAGGVSATRKEMHDTLQKVLEKIVSEGSGSGGSGVGTAPGDGECPKGSEGSEGSTEGSGESDEPTPSTAPVEEEGDAESPDCSTSSGEENSDNDSEATGQADTSPTHTYDEADIEWDVQQKLLDRFNDELGDPHGSNFIVNTTDDIVKEEASLRVGPGWLDMLESLPCYDEFPRLGGALAVRMKQALAVPTRRYLVNREQGSINPRTIYRVAAGLPRGFRKKLPVEAVDTCIMLGIDASSSMRGGRQELARDLAFIWNDACRRLKVPLFVYDWSTNPGAYGQQSYDSGGQAIYARVSGLVIRVLKDWHSNPTSRRTLNNMASSGIVMGSTPTGESLAFGCERLAKRRETKKILFFLTDGIPDYGKGHCKYIVDVMTEAKRRGLIVCALGMDAQDQRNVFAGHWFHVHTASDFIRVTTKTLVNVIRNWRP